MPPPTDKIKYEEWVKKQSEAQRGKHRSEETKKKISEANKGKPSGMKNKHHSEEVKKRISDANIGKHPSEITKKKMSDSHHGDKNYNWKGGKKLRMLRKKNKRNRELGFDSVNEPLHIDDEVAHHLTKDYVAFVPEYINKSVSHNIYTGKNMDEINFYSLNYLFLVYNRGK
jgi:hypothetical protein